MRRTMILTLFLIGISLPSWAAREVQGRVEITDENGATTFPLPCEVKIYAAPLGKSKASDIRCSRKEGVDSDTGAFSYLVPSDCDNRDLELWVELYPPYFWERQPEMRVVIWQQIAGNSVGLDPFRVIRPSRLGPAARQANLEKAATFVDKDWNVSVALLEEASRGGDIRFTMESIDFLEKSARSASGEEQVARFKSVYDFIDQSETELSLEAPENRFRIAMRKANAAYAAGLPDQALASASRAVAIYPRNPQAPSIAFASVSEEFKTSNPEELTEALEQNDQLLTAYQAVYDGWKAPGKPALLVMGKAEYRVNADALAFAKENVYSKN